MTTRAPAESGAGAAEKTPRAACATASSKARIGGGAGGGGGGTRTGAATGAVAGATAGAGAAAAGTAGAAVAAATGPASGCTQFCGTQLASSAEASASPKPLAAVVLEVLSVRRIEWLPQLLLFCHRFAAPAIGARARGRGRGQRRCRRSVGRRRARPDVRRRGGRSRRPVQLRQPVLRQRSELAARILLEVGLEVLRPSAVADRRPELALHAPGVELGGRRRRWRDGLVKIEVTLHGRLGPRLLLVMRVGAHARDHALEHLLERQPRLVHRADEFGSEYAVAAARPVLCGLARRRRIGDEGAGRRVHRR